MPFSFPDFNIEVSKRTEEWGRQIVDSAISENIARDGRIKKMNKNYQSYNGNVEEEAIKWLTKTYGKASRTKYIDYKLIRDKIKRIIGEFLEIGFHCNVNSINPDAINEKLDNLYYLLGAAHAKDQLNRVKQVTDVDVTDGMQIPDKDNPNIWQVLTPKQKTETIMQRIINYKIEHEKLKPQFVTNVTDTIITAECFGKIERDKNGNDTYRAIDPRYALYVEQYGDWLLKKTPYIGEYRTMYVYEILKEFDLTLTQQQQLKTAEYGTQGYETMGLRILNDQHSADTYTVQWRSLTPLISKISPSKDIQGLDDKSIESSGPYVLRIDPKDYEQHKEKYDNEVKKGEYKIVIEWKEDVYQMSRIGNSIYTPMEKITDQIQRRNGGKYYSVSFEYCGLLYSTVDNIRISLQELGNEIQVFHNIVMFQLQREVNKIKGSAFGYDKAYIPGGKNMRDVMFNLTEDGFLEYDSSEDGVRDNDKMNSANAIREIKFGENTTIKLLLELKNELELAAEKITGITRDREGLTPASSTVTNAQQNINASRSITNDIFYCVNEYFEDVLTRLCEKTKLNKDWLRNIAPSAIGSDAVAFLAVSDKISYDEYQCEINDGKRDNDIKDKIRSLFPAELNTQQIRTKDIVRFEAEKNLTECIAILDKASSEISKIAQEQTNGKLAQENQQLKSQLQQTITDKNDLYQHQIDMEVLKGKGKEDQIALEHNLSHADKVFDTRADLFKQNMQQEHEKELAANEEQNNQNNNQQK